MPDNRFVMAWDKKVVVFYLTFSSNGKHLLDDHLERFFKADPKKSLVTNPYFKEFSQRKKDFGVWLDPKRGLELYKEMMGRYGIFSNDQLGLNKIEPKDKPLASAAWTKSCCLNLRNSALKNRA